MYYTDNRRDIYATHSISAMMLDDILGEHREKMLAHIAYDLSRGLREEAEKIAAALKWERHLFVEITPHEWPDISPEAMRIARFFPGASVEVRASGYLFECLPKWKVRVMETPYGPLFGAALRPVATLRGDRGFAIAGDGTIFFWPDKPPQSHSVPEVMV